VEALEQEEQELEEVELVLEASKHQECQRMVVQLEVKE